MRREKKMEIYKYKGNVGTYCRGIREEREARRMGRKGEKEGEREKRGRKEVGFKRKFHLTRWRLPLAVREGEKQTTYM